MLPVCILVSFPIYIDTISWKLPILYSEGFLNCDIFLSLKVILILANSAYPDEI